MTVAIGCRLTGIEDAAQGVRLPVALLYPAEGGERPVAFGPYRVDLAVDAPPRPGHRRLVVVSHGNGGTPWVHRDLARRLAADGFVVALPEHLGNSRSDNGLAGTVANLENRPRHLSRAIDAARADPVLGATLADDADRVGVVGHSIGAYGALAAAGGRPWAGPPETRQGPARPVAVRRDARIAAIVLLAPATPWFAAPGALDAVRVPILMRTGERDTVTPHWMADLVRDGVPDPDRVDHAVVPGAGHFAFQSPFPPALARPDFPPSQDPPGFDRRAFLPGLHAEIAAFFRDIL